MPSSSLWVCGHALWFLSRSLASAHCVVPLEPAITPRYRLAHQSCHACPAFPAEQVGWPVLSLMLQSSCFDSEEQQLGRRTVTGMSIFWLVCTVGKSECTLQDFKAKWTKLSTKLHNDHTFFCSQEHFATAAGGLLESHRTPPPNTWGASDPAPNPECLV